MKTTTIIIIIISVAVLVTGILYGEHPRTDSAKVVTLEETCTTQTPEPTPDFVIEPMNSFPVY